MPRASAGSRTLRVPRKIRVRRREDARGKSKLRYSFHSATILGQITAQSAPVIGALLESIVDSGLFHDAVGSVSRLDGGIYGESPMTNRTLPDFVVASSGANKSTSVSSQGFLHIRCVVTQDARIVSRKSQVKWYATSLG